MANDVTAEVKAAAGEEAVDAAETEVASNTMEQWCLLQWKDSLTENSFNED